MGRMAIVQGGRALITTPRCPHCGMSGEIEAAADEYLAWVTGTLIQRAFPTMSADEREMLMTGIHPKCWDEIFGGDDN